MQYHNEIYNFHSLLAAIIETAISDLKGISPGCGYIERDRAWYFLQSDVCESYCAELAIDYDTIRKKAAALYNRR